jgi:hypothetical protein
MNIGTPDAPTAGLDRIGDEIAELSAHLDAATARLLDLIREFDARGGWANGFRSCAAWLSWRVGFAPGAAREHVRVARVLATLPLLSRALARGELSYAKIRELTRVATPETEERLLAVGRAGTAEHVERIVRGWRRMDAKAETQEAARQHAGRSLHVYQDEDGMVKIRGRLTPEVGALLVKALDAAREALHQKRRDPGRHASRRGRARDRGRRSHPHDSTGDPSSAPPPGSRLSLPGLRCPLRPGASHPSLGPGRPHHALESRVTLSPAPTARSTRRATSSSAGRTECFSSEGPMDG